MAASKLTFNFLLLNFLASLLIPEITLCDHSRQPKRHVAMFIFGDSIFDAGNDNYINLSVSDRANYWPYGETFFHFPTGRFTDGRLIVDFIATEIGQSFVPPYLQPGINFTNGVNFASGGAGVFSETDPQVISLGMQLSNFKNVANSMEEQLGDKEANKRLSQAVYATCVGGNDYSYFVDNYPKATQLEQDEFVKNLVGNLTDFVKELYTFGARKFAILNVGPRGCLPAVRQSKELRGDECDEASLEMIKKHNSAASKAIKELESKLSGFKYSILDFYTILFDMIKDPKAYGFKESRYSCCGHGMYNAAHCGIEPYTLCKNPSEYLFFDGWHPTEHGYRILADLFWNGKPSIAAPFNLRQLFDLESTPVIISSEEYEVPRDE
ncbi:GDSL esterase/lipase 4-like [Populus alba x Populus x berolinensis]|uniref:GDSL esterase/lipase 4-like n=1 Tax=Populus alba x Populus x berolinensis TaxID=444605 RepID=A0AAD6QJD4_9ROSI|nr:GDSL esterase/lipase 4-like [Populus alba x Populus x berolinensis]